MAASFSIIIASIFGLCCLRQVSTLCSPGCASCVNGDNICDSCNEGFWPYNNECSPCPENCKTCSDNTTCQSCLPHFYGLDIYKCQKPCSSNCTNSECQDKDGYCNKCYNGSYGPTCGESCNLCRNAQCGLRRCSQGCADGYVQSDSGDFSYCFSCPANCLTCLNTTYCTQCTEQYYPYDYKLVERGRSDCRSCSGSCTNCESILYCSSCHQIAGKLECSQCKNGYKLDKTQCVKTCPISCNDGCDESGMCIFGCKDGYVGQSCSYPCPNNCLKCNTQFLCASCKDGYYTDKCNEHCNENCLIGELPRCRFEDGYCLNGCSDGNWGEICEHTCSVNCRSNGNSIKLCYRNGTCSYGCDDGFVGANCSTITLTPSTPLATMVATSNNNHLISQSTKTKTADAYSSVSGTQSKPLRTEHDVPLAAIGGGVGGGVLVLIIVIVIGCLIIKKNQHRKERPKVVSVVSNEAVNPIFDPEIPNTTSNQHQTSQPIGYIYAQPNKPKKPTSIKDSVGDTQNKTYGIIEIDMNEDNDAGEETDSEDIVKLEDLDDGEIDIIVADNPISDTYYNTEGLVRSRIQVSKLPSYIHDKSDFQSEFERLPKTLTRSCNEALKRQNRAKNRYNGVYSYDATRVVLGSKEYINASHIEGYNSSMVYIASLGPTKSTMPKFAVFWEMVWQENTQKIVVLTNLMESGKIKCDQYWPDNDSSRQYGSISVYANAEHVYAEFVVRELHVVKAGESRTVTQYHYIAWPDKSVPDTVVSLIEFRDIVEKKRTPNAGPIIVHCSAGIGRTGTYIALDTLIKEGRAENSVDIFGCVNALRGQRVHMIQNVEQYVFLHHCVLYALTCQPGPLDVSSLTSYTRDDNMTFQFQALTSLPPLANKDSDYIATNTKRKENRKGSDIPGDHHRVKLAGTKKDYINAVFVDGYLQKDRYILAQTPMSSTLEDFVSLLYQEKIGLVVYLDEDDLKDKTVGQYVAPANKVSKIGHFTVSTASCESGEDFVVRTLKISKIGESNANDLNIRHYQFQCWKNMDIVPESLRAFMSLLTAVAKHCRPESGTVLFHCLDGATKSGLMCAVAIMLEKLAVERELSVINTICHVRGRRRKALQDFDQFKFCYNCVREHLETSEAKAYYNIL